MTDQELIKKFVEASKQSKAMDRLKNGEPIQYIIGNVDFCGNIIDVDERVLIPRFETERLVDLTVCYAKKMFKNKVNILDLGCGSGCISISLKKMLISDVTAIDISNDALDLAKSNALKNNVQINFFNRNMEEKIDGCFDIIISNPPYIPEDGYVQDVVKNNEPSIALFAKDKGLYYYKKILDYAFLILNKPGLIAFEIGDNQKTLLDEYLKTFFNNVRYEFRSDYAGLDRYLFIFNE